MHILHLLKTAEDGWIENDGNLTFNWFNGDQFSKSVKEIIIEAKNKDELRKNEGKNVIQNSPFFCIRYSMRQTV